MININTYLCEKKKSIIFIIILVPKYTYSKNQVINIVIHRDTFGKMLEKLEKLRRWCLENQFIT